jgi:hypothetical protein
MKLELESTPFGEASRRVRVECAGLAMEAEIAHGRHSCGWDVVIHVRALGVRIGVLDSDANRALLVASETCATRLAALGVRSFIAKDFNRAVASAVWSEPALQAC